MWAPIRAAQLGKKSGLRGNGTRGGTCLNWGCIPTKALLKSAELKQILGHIGDYGLSVGEVGFDFPKVMQRSRGVSDQMAKGVEYLFKTKKSIISSARRRSSRRRMARSKRSMSPAQTARRRRLPARP